MNSSILLGEIRAWWCLLVRCVTPGSTWRPAVKLGNPEWSRPLCVWDALSAPLAFFPLAASLAYASKQQNISSPLAWGTHTTNWACKPSKKGLHYVMVSLLTWHCARQPAALCPRLPASVGLRDPAAPSRPSSESESCRSAWLVPLGETADS